jgi:hypothetical protein
MKLRSCLVVINLRRERHHKYRPHKRKRTSKSDAERNEMQLPYFINT